MNGIGNDFVVVADLSGKLPDGLDRLAVQLCDPATGPGADGLILATPGRRAPLLMRMWNPDGSESEMCGNGIRCFARYVVDSGLIDARSMSIETGAGVLHAEILESGDVRVNMGPAWLRAGEIGMSGDPDCTVQEEAVPGGLPEWRGTAVSMGNPHLVIFVPDTREVDLPTWGPLLERDPRFPRRVNVHFAQVLTPRHALQRTWERGAGITQACGTGACAVAVAGKLAGLLEPVVTVSLPGGDLTIDTSDLRSILMTGPAEYEHFGSLEWPEG